MTRILLIRIDHLGDVLLTLPIVDAFATASVDAQVDVLTSPDYVSLVSGDTRIARTWSWPASRVQQLRLVGALRERRYDWAIDLHATPHPGLRSCLALAVGADCSSGHGWSWWRRSLLTHAEPRRSADMHAVETYLALCRPAGTVRAGLGRLHLDAPGAERARAWLDAHTDRTARRVALVPGARLDFKRWPARRFAALGSALCRAGVAAYVVGHESDAPVVAEVTAECVLPVFLSRDLHSLAATLAQAQVVVSNDSGLKHLAAAVGTPVVGIYGHTDPRMWRAWGTAERILRGNDGPCDCSARQVDRTALFTCQKTVDEQQVFDATVELLGL